MGFLQRLFRPPGPAANGASGIHGINDGNFVGGGTHDACDPTNLAAGGFPNQTSFQQLTDQQLRTHMGVRRYGAFELTEAIRPAFDAPVPPRQGFRRDRYVDDLDGSTTPVIMAAVTAGQLMEAFLELIDTLGPVVDVVLESSHHSGPQDDLHRGHIDTAVLKSAMLEFEDVLLDDGCAGIAVINPARRQEVQLDEHKLLIAYGQPLAAVEKSLIASDVYPDPSIRFVTEAEHIHSSTQRLFHRFGQLKIRLGIDDGVFG